MAKNLEDLKRLKAREDGEKSEKIKIAKKLLETNASIEYVMEVTGLTEEEVKKLC